MNLQTRSHGGFEGSFVSAAERKTYRPGLLNPPWRFCPALSVVTAADSMPRFRISRRPVAGPTAPRKESAHPR